MFPRCFLKGLAVLFKWFPKCFVKHLFMFPKGFQVSARASWCYIVRLAWFCGEGCTHSRCAVWRCQGYDRAQKARRAAACGRRRPISQGSPTQHCVRSPNMPLFNGPWAMGHWPGGPCPPWTPPCCCSMGHGPCAMQKKCNAKKLQCKENCNALPGHPILTRTARPARPDAKKQCNAEKKAT